MSRRRPRTGPEKSLVMDDQQTMGGSDSSASWKYNNRTVRYVLCATHWIPNKCTAGSSESVTYLAILAMTERGARFFRRGDIDLILNCFAVTSSSVDHGASVLRDGKSEGMAQDNQETKDRVASRLVSHDKA